MAIDQVPEQESISSNPPQGSTHSTWFAVIFLTLAGLAGGEIYTLHKVGAVRDSLQTQQTKIQKAYANQLSDRFTALERSNAEQLGAVKQELDAASKRMGNPGKVLGRARTMLKQLEEEQKQEAEALKQEIARKADQQQLLALTQDVSNTKTDLDSTKKTVGTLTQDLGMARSEFGTLIARNHDEIEQLRKLGDRDYFEFTLERDHPQRVANVGLTLKKINVKRHRFNFFIAADDMEIEKKDRTANEPIFFYVGGSKKPYELVVNKVQSRQVVGYISAPKGAVQTQVASRSEGGR